MQTQQNHALNLRVGHIRPEAIRRMETQFKQLGRQLRGSRMPGSSRRNGALDLRGSGCYFNPVVSRLQRSVVKVSFAKNTKTRSWTAHGKYLQRHHAQEHDKAGVGFNDQKQDLDIAETLQQWQQSGDARFFKVIVTPENAHGLDMREHVKQLMRQVEKDLQVTCEWMAIDHHNTDHDHVHLLIRGVYSHGRELTIDPKYIAEGFRQRSQELATQVLGLRTQHDIRLARERQIEKSYLTEIDRSLRFKAINGIVTYDTPIPKNNLSRERRLQEIQRLKFLETLGLAEQTGKKTWRLHENLESTLREMQLSQDIIKSRAQHKVGPLDLQTLYKPSHVEVDKPIAGKVIGMGLEHELLDRRYLLVDGIDGQIHYVTATASMVKARDNAAFKNGDVVELSLQQFTNDQQETISYVAVENHQTVEKILASPTSRLDTDTLNYVAQHQQRPAVFADASDFAKTYRAAMADRFDVLARAGVFIPSSAGHVPVLDAEQKLDDIQHRRICPQFATWRPELDKAKPDKSLVGEIVASNARKLLIKDIRGSYHQISTPDLGQITPPAGSLVYLRSNRPPGLDFSNTDKRIADWGGYDAVSHKATLLKQLKSKKDFFLANEKEVDAFVLAHQRRADTWVKWEILENNNGLYQPKQAGKNLEMAMQQKLDDMKQQVANKPALYTKLTKDKLKLDQERFTLTDKLLSEVGIPPKTENNWVAKTLRIQAGHWQARGIVIDRDFEKNARQWCRTSATLEQVEKHQGRKPRIIDIQQPARYEGKVIAMGVKDRKGRAHLVLEHKGELLAFAASKQQLKQLQPGQAVTVANNQQKEWRISFNQQRGQGLALTP